METTTTLTALKMIFPAKLLVPIMVIFFAVSVGNTTGKHTTQPKPGTEKKDTVTFVQKTLYPITHPPKLFKK